MHEISFTDKAEQDVKALDASVAKRVLKVADRLSHHPELAKPLFREFKDVYSYRFGTPSGEFRLAFSKEGNKLLVLAVGTRENFYRDLRRRL